MWIFTSLNLLVFAGLLFLLRYFLVKTNKLSNTVFIALILGVVFGIALQAIYHIDSPILLETDQWINVVGSGYVRLLQMIVMPLVFISILSAVAKLHNAGSLGKISSLVIFLLLFTTAISAIVGISMAHLFHLSVDGLLSGSRELAAQEAMSNRIGQVSQLTIPNMLLSFIPKNPFAELAGANPTSVISTVIFSGFLGVAILRLYKADEVAGAKVVAAIELLNKLVMSLVRLVIRLTPYGVFALMIQITSNTKLADILSLVSFIVASYLAIFIMFLVHGLLLVLVGINPIKFFKKALPTLIFAFTSRSSAASIPFNVETQTNKMGVSNVIANFSASFGATIGQNGCAGIYPAMLAVMVAPTVGIDPMTPHFLWSLIAIVTVSSLGVAGVGGGATFASIIVLSTMGLPLTLVALLISIEPLIDMGRTMLNVNGSMTVGTVTSKLLGQTNDEVFTKEK